ncbi:hypothetical protein KEM56_007432 [Ascosphaera pollenicola]|nr:hypothetical protein KEM56_007432 [Ascosphaera pollenicola]
MGTFKDFLKTAIVPAAISLAIYLVLFFVLIPLIRNTRQRYARYLPLNAISEHTSSLRDRISLAFVTCAFNSRRRSIRQAEEDDFDEDEGEGMVGFEMDPSQRAFFGRQTHDASDSRLNRDLEAGFRDDSDHDDPGDTDRRLSRQQ